MLNIIALTVLLLLMVGLLIRYQQHSAKIFGGAMLVTLACGWISAEELLSNTANQGLATLIMLILISFALEKTGLLRRVSRFLFTDSEPASVWRTMGLSALASSLLNNTAVVAALLNAVCGNKKVAASRLLIPLSYASIMGGTLTLVGTSTNLIVNSMFIDAGYAGFNFFDFTLVGGIVLVGGLITLFIVSRFLPTHHRESKSVEEYYVEAELEADSSLVGQSVDEAGLRHLDDLFLAEVVRKGGRQVLRPVAPYDVLQAGDKLLFSGDVSKVKTLNQFDGVKLFADDSGLETHKLTEVIVREESVLVGRTLKSTGFRARFDAAVVAIRRDGAKITGKLGDVRLQAGDFLLLATGEDFSSRTNISKNFYLLSGLQPENMLSGWRESLTLWGFVAMIAGTVATGASLFYGVLFLLATLLVSNCLNVNELKRRFPIEIWVIVASALCLAEALVNTGAAQLIADFAGDTVASDNPFWLLAGVFIVTYVLTEVITNNAAAALMFPVAYSLSLGAGVDPFPIILGVAFAASASFITPYGYQTNLMVFNASQYRLKHFLYSGAPMALVYTALSLFAISWVWQ